MTSRSAAWSSITVPGSTLTVSVLRDQVNDFSSSRTVVDAISKQLLPVAIPRHETADSANLVMQLQLPAKSSADAVLA
jgi:hypothetical protein